MPFTGLDKILLTAELGEVKKLRAIAALFSMLMPGMGQLYNRHYWKSIIFFIIEYYENSAGHINNAIQLDFNGFHEQAMKIANFGDILFYPGFYAYCVWDAWFYSKPGADKVKTAVPFLVGGFLGELTAIFAIQLPRPTLISGLSLVTPMLIGLVIFRKQ